MTTAICGRDLRVGDTIETWCGADTIIALEPYTPPESLADCFPGGAQIARFARNRCGMSIAGDDAFVVVARRD